MANELKFGNKVIFLGGNPISLAVAASDPGSAVNGDMYYNSTLDVVRVYQGGAWVSLATGSGGVGAGVAGNLSLYPSSGSSVDDVYTQNGQAINVAIAAQGTRAVPLTYTLPNPGDSVGAASVVLTEGNQTLNGNKTLSGTTNLSALTASRPLKLDASKNIIAGSIDLANGVDTTGVLPVTSGGTNSSAALNNNRVMQSSGGAIVEAAAITASRALISDANGIPTHSSVTSTELGYVSGVTSAIQTQLNAKAADADVIKKDGSVAFTADQSMGGFKLTNVASPVSSTDAANKAYVDSVAEGLKPKAAVRAASTGNVVIASELENGDTLDGVTLATGDRVLLKDQSTPSQNGIYIVAASGAATRSTDFDSLTPIDEINGAYVPVEEGTENSGKIFVQSGGTVTVIGTDPINFVYFNSISNLVGGDGITISGVNISVDHDGQGLQFSAGQLSLELDGSTLSKSASGLKVADGGISNLQINAAAAIDATKLGNGDVDNTELSYLNGVTSAIQTQLNGKANTALSNLASTAVNTDINPDTNNTRALGSASLQYAIVRSGGYRSYDYASPSTTGDITSGSNVITNVADTSGFAVDMVLVGPGIGNRNFITAVGANTITLEQNATSTLAAAVISAQYETVNRTGNQTGNATSGGIAIRTGSSAVSKSGVLLLRTGTSSSGDSGDIIITTGGASGLRGSVNIDANNLNISGSGAAIFSMRLEPNADDNIDIGSASLNFSSLHSKSILSSTDLLLEATNGNLDIKATKIRRSEDGASTNYMEDQYFDALTLAANTSVATEVSADLSFALASFDGAVINYRIKEATSNKVRIGQLVVSTDGTAASSSDQFSETASLGNATGLSLTADVSGGNVRILFNNTHASNACTMRAQIRRFRA